MLRWRSLRSLASCHGDGLMILTSGRCCIYFRSALRDSRLMSTFCRVPNAIALTRKVTITQDYKAASGIVARFFTQQVMNASGDNGGSQAGHSGSPRGGNNRFRGRGRYVSHGGGRPVRPRSSLDEYRYWLHAKNKSPSDHKRFVIASYNVLADQNVQRHWREYWHIPPFIMDWDARKRKLLRELGLWSPDIICLQEVDRYEDLKEGLQEGGYVGVYTARTGDTRDGCAMFWRENRFELLELESIYFKDHNLRDNVAQVCVLQTKSKSVKRSDTEDTDDTEPTPSGSCDSKNNRVVVGNIHVLFNPKRGDVKLGQIRMLLEKAHAISQKWGNAPVALAGDFNSTPGSALYQFISSSQLDLACHDRRDISGQEGEGQNESYRTSGYSNKASRYDTVSWSSQGEGAEAKAEAGAEAGAKSGAEEGTEAEAEVGAEAGEEAGAKGGTETGAEARSEEEPLLDPEPSVVSLEIIDTDESILVTTGEVDLATEIIEQNTSRVTLETVYTPKRTRGWFEDELIAATGERNVSVVQHKLKLRSAYSEIEGKPGTRDERGEPFITTFHKGFRGTVDYIWHTDDLYTVRVLDTLSTSVLEQCRGLPSKKWGSDHMALVCEFSFVPKEDTRQNAVSRETESDTGKS